MYLLKDREYADLCVLPELTEQTLLDNLRDRFNNGIYCILRSAPLMTTFLRQNLHLYRAHTGGSQPIQLLPHLQS